MVYPLVLDSDPRFWIPRSSETSFQFLIWPTWLEFVDFMRSSIILLNSSKFKPHWPIFIHAQAVPLWESVWWTFTEHPLVRTCCLGLRYENYIQYLVSANPVWIQQDIFALKLGSSHYEHQHTMCYLHCLQHFVLFNFQIYHHSANKLFSSYYHQTG